MRIIEEFKEVIHHENNVTPQRIVMVLNTKYNLIFVVIWERSAAQPEGRRCVSPTSITPIRRKMIESEVLVGRRQKSHRRSYIFGFAMEWIAANERQRPSVWAQRRRMNPINKTLMERQRGSGGRVNNDGRFSWTLRCRRRRADKNNMKNEWSSLSEESEMLYIVPV